jgi:protein phosphatase
MRLNQGKCQYSGYSALFAGISDAGRTRPSNEDALLILADSGLFAVADGLGGLEAGDIASRTALQYLKDFYSPPSTPAKLCSTPPRIKGPSRLEEIIVAINTRIYQQKMVSGKNMATTLAMVQLCDEMVTVAHVGDSRVYHWRAGVLSRMTSDHSLVNELFLKGILTAFQAEHSPQRHIITRAIGADATITPTVQSRVVHPGDILLLCTDGLTNMLPDTRIMEIIENGLGDLGKTVEQLVLNAYEAGGHDNLTVIMLAIS